MPSASVCGRIVDDDCQYVAGERCSTIKSGTVDVIMTPRCSATLKLLAMLPGYTVSCGAAPTPTLPLTAAGDPDEYWSV